MDTTTLAQIRMKTFRRSKGLVLMNRLVDRLTKDTYAVFVSRSLKWWTGLNLHTKSKFSINYNVIYFTTSLSVCGLVWAQSSSLLSYRPRQSLWRSAFEVLFISDFRFLSKPNLSQVLEIKDEEKTVLSNISFLLRFLFCRSRRCRNIQNTAARKRNGKEESKLVSVK